MIWCVILTTSQRNWVIPERIFGTKEEKSDVVDDTVEWVKKMRRRRSTAGGTPTSQIETSMKDLVACRSTNLSTFGQQQGLPTTEEMPNNEQQYEYTSRQILYSYWWCFWHICLRCIRRVRLTPATSDAFGFHPDMISPDQLGGILLLIS